MTRQTSGFGLLLLILLMVGGCRTTGTSTSSDEQQPGEKQPEPDPSIPDGGPTAPPEEPTEPADKPCAPPLKVCDAARQCGCQEGETCQVGFTAESGTYEECVPDTGGTHVTQHKGCVEGSCVPGNLCLPMVDADDKETTICVHWCYEDAHCERIPGAQCKLPLQVGQDPNGDPVYLDPYRVCTLGRPGADAGGKAHFRVCVGKRDQCPGGPTQTFSIDGEENGTCTVVLGEKTELRFALFDEQQGLSVTGNQLFFEPKGEEFSLVECGERFRFSIFLPLQERPFSTTQCSSPASTDTCELWARYNEAGQGFDLRFTCQDIDMSHTDERLVTLSEQDALGPGSVTMGRCAIESAPADQP